MRYLCSFRRRALQSPCKPTETVVPSLAFGPTISVPYDTVHDAFRAQAEAHPSQTAVVDFTGHSVSYGELDRLSVQLSVRLRAEGVGSGARVCLLIERSIAQTVAIMAVLRAGATYVPLDGCIVTDDTLASILEDAQPAFTLIEVLYVPRTMHPHASWMSGGHDCRSVQFRIIICGIIVCVSRIV